MSTSSQTIKMNIALNEVKLEPSELSEGSQIVPPSVLTNIYPSVQFNFNNDPEECITEGDGNNPVDTPVNVSFDWSREIKSEVDTTTDESSSSADDTAFYHESAESTPGFSNTIENNAIFRNEHQFQRVLHQFCNETSQPFMIRSSTKNTYLATGINHLDFPHRKAMYRCIQGDQRRRRGRGVHTNQPSTECSAHFRVNWHPSDNVLKITKCELEHNHELTPELFVTNGREARAPNYPRIHYQRNHRR